MNQGEEANAAEQQRGIAGTEITKELLLTLLPTSMGLMLAQLLPMGLLPTRLLPMRLMLAQPLITQRLIAHLMPTRPMQPTRRRRRKLPR